MEKKKTTKFSCKVLLILDETPNDKGSTRLQVAKWNNNAICLEKRVYFNNGRFGRRKGFTLDDIDVVADKLDAIEKIMDV